VESVKDTKHLQKNLIRYISPDNENMRDVYNQMRVQIAFIIRELEEMRESGDGVIDMSSLDSLKLVVNEDREKINALLSDLIGKRAITPIMGSSLMNDSGYAINIMTNLILAAETLFVARDVDLTQTVHEILDDYHELDNVVSSDMEPDNDLITSENADECDRPAR
jgi:phosphate:Na+ symporter